MLRLTLLTAWLWCATQHGLVTRAEQPARSVVVAANRATASAIPPLPVGTKLLVLIQHEDEPDDVVHQRALAMRHATHFVILSGQETPLSAMYRERLANQGAVAITLNQHGPVRRGSRHPAAVQPIDSLLAALSIQD